MKIIKLTIFLLFFYSSANAQLFVEVNTGYGISINKLRKEKTYPIDNTEEADPLHPFYKEKKNKIISTNIFVGEGITNSLSLGYRFKKHVGLKLSANINHNKLNLNYLDSINSYNYYEDHYYTTDTLYFHDYPNFNEFYKKDSRMDKRYSVNIISISPELFFYYKVNNLEFEISGGPTFNHIKLIENQYFSTVTKSKSYLWSYKGIMKIERQNKFPKISYQLGINIDYKIYNNLYFQLKIYYNHLKYKFKKGIKDYNTVLNENGEITYYKPGEYTKEILFNEKKYYSFGDEDRMCEYNFSTFAINMGIKFYFKN